MPQKAKPRLSGSRRRVASRPLDTEQSESAPEPVVEDSFPVIKRPSKLAWLPMPILIIEAEANGAIKVQGCRDIYVQLPPTAGARS